MSSSLTAINAVEYVANQVSSKTIVLAPCVGDYKFSAFPDDVKGWLKCDGRLLQEGDYPALFSVIGTAFGSSGAGTFRLPNCSGRVPAAIGASVAGSHALGEVVGEETHVLTVPEMPSHAHTGTTNSAGTHNHGGSTGTSAPSSWAQGMAAMGGGNDVSEDAGAHSHTIASDGAHTHTFTTDSTGGDAAHNIMQPTIYLGNVFIFSGNERLAPLLPLRGVYTPV